MKIERSRSADIEKLGRLIRDVRVAMLTTIAPDGTLVSRPLHTLKMEFDGDLWFITPADSGKVVDIARDEHVNLAYAAPDQNTYVSIRGRAQVLRDSERIQEVWSKELDNLFPQGSSDPNIALIRVEVDSAEYWTGGRELVASFLDVAAQITGRGVPHTGGHGVIDLPQQH